MGLTIWFSAFILGRWYWENHFDTFHLDNDRIFAVTTCNLGKNEDGSDTEHNQLHKDYIGYFVKNIPEIETHSCTFWFPLTYNIKVNDNIQPFKGLNVDTAFFGIFYSDFIETVIIL